MALEPDGGLAVTTPTGSFRDEQPSAWQEDDTTITAVPAAYRLTGPEDGAWSYGFEVGAYDPARALLIDPEPSSTRGTSAAAPTMRLRPSPWMRPAPPTSPAPPPRSRRASPTGMASARCPGPDRTFNGDQDAFIAKVRPDGRGLVYIGYIGGSASEFGLGVAVDVAGNAYVTGETASDETSFPVGSGFGALPGRITPTTAATRTPSSSR